MKNIKAFTFFEIIISIILVSILYGFAMNSFHTSSDKKQIDTTLINLKKELLSYEYENSIKIYCDKEDLGCFVFVDGVELEEKMPSLFQEEPTVYKYNENLELIDFEPLELDRIESYSIIFEYGCDKYRKCTETIVFERDGGYIFNDIYTQPILVQDTSEIMNYFQDKVQEVKDAF